MKNQRQEFIKACARPALLATALIATGCATQIDSIAVSPALEGESATVTVKVNPFLTAPHTPSMEVRNDTNGTAYAPAGTLPSTGSNEYSGPLTAHTYGMNTLKVEVPYTIVLPPVRRSTSREQPFVVGARAACFAFDAAQPNAQGWTMAGLFGNGDPDWQIATCGAGIGGAPARIASDNVPQVFETGFGALSYTLPTACFPATLPPGAKYWAIDFRSPELALRPEWQAYRVSFAIRAADVLILAGARPSVQAILKVRKPDGRESYFAELAGSGFRFEPITSAWQQFTFTMQPPAGTTVLQVMIRVFGEVPVVLPDSWVRLDLVCPE